MIAFIFQPGGVRGMVITGAFGTTADLDSFNAANRIAELLFNWWQAVRSLGIHSRYSELLVRGP